MSSANEALWIALGVQCGQSANAAVESVSKELVKALQPLHKKFPPGPRYDIALDMATDPLRCMERLKANYGGLVGFKLATKPVVLVSSPYFAKHIFTSANFVKAGTAFFPGSSLAGNGLLVSDGDVWLRQRRLSNPAFRKAAIRTYAEAMTSLTYQMAEEEWQAGGVRDVYADLNKLTMNIVSAALFGNSRSEVMEGVVSSISTAFKFFARRATSMFLIPEWIPTIDNIQYHSAVSNLDRVVYRMIKDRRLQLASFVLNKQDLLTRLLQERDSDGSQMDDVFLRDELMTFLVAGQETSSIALAWCLAMLAMHQDVQNKLQSEVNKVLEDRTPSVADIENLPYTEAVVLETMRLLPPAYAIGRCAREDSTLGDWCLPAGTTTLISLYLLHRDPLYWPRSMEFAPERWLGTKSHDKNDSYWPFGGGPRNCIGSGFAMLELSLVLSILIRKYSFSLPKGHLFPKPQATITLRPESPMHLKIVQRRR